MDDLINISPYQMFLLHIRSPKTKSQYTKKFEHFFKFLTQQLGEKEFETENIEKKYFLLYEKAKNESWLFNCLLKYVHFLNRRVETENLSGATFHNYFKNIKKFCLANDIEVKWHKLFLSAPKKRRAAIDRPSSYGTRNKDNFRISR